MTEIPLRLCRRRDGSMALTDAAGHLDTDERTFPPRHLFIYRWLYGEGSDVAKASGGGTGSPKGGEITVELVNARAVYRIVPNEDEHLARQGALAELVSQEMFDAPPIDEDRAAEIQAEIAMDRPGVSLTEEQAEAAARAMGEEV